MRSCINSLLGESTDAVPVIEMFSHLTLKRLSSEYVCTGDKQLTNKHVNTVITAIILDVFDRVWQELVFASAS